jgi:molybdopterin-containing oxidoreductase family membrane subunit
VHSIVSLDFAVSVLPGWHSTIFPPYFVAGAILSGSAMVIKITILMRQISDYKRIIDIDHLEKLNQIILAMSWIVGYTYIVEFFYAFEYGNIHEVIIYIEKGGGFLFPAMVVCNFVLPQLFWIKRIRRSVVFMFIISIFINIGMIIERYEIVVLSQEKAFLPNDWTNYVPSTVEIGIFAGSAGLFMFLYLLFMRCIPAVNIWETEYYNK